MLGRSDLFKLDARDRLGGLLAMLVAAKENVLREKKTPQMYTFDRLRPSMCDTTRQSCYETTHQTEQKINPVIYNPQCVEQAVIGAPNHSLLSLA
jgi:hypothetical protein